MPLDINELKARSWNLMNKDKPRPRESAVRPVRGDMFNLPFEDESFDGGISINVVNSCNTYQVYYLLKEIYRVLKPRGFLILSSFGYYESTENGKVSYNNEFKRNDIIQVNIVKALAKRTGYSETEDVSLDMERIKTELKKADEYKNKNSQNKVEVKVVAPFGLLLRK